MKISKRGKTAMSLSETYRATRSLEAMENYGKAAMPRITSRGMIAPLNKKRYVSDERFWRSVIKPQSVWGMTVRLENFALSEWVARVPGLFHSKGALAMRALADDEVDYTSNEWRVLNPLGKSMEVMGGKGSLRLPPDERDYRLVSLSSLWNASSGVPALISPEVWEYHALQEGSLIKSVEGKWQSMFGNRWAERFPSVRGIPKGYLIVDQPEKLKRDELKRVVPTQFHPFTVMEYASGSAKLYDFVYATADTGVPRYRSKLMNFFKEYKQKKERYGRYLLSADVSDPLWESEFERPEDLMRAQPSSRSQLELLQARVRADCFKGKNLDAIVQMLAEKYDGTGLQRVSRMINVPPAQWYTERAAADLAADLLALCLQRGKVEELLDVVAAEYPYDFV